MLCETTSVKECSVDGEGVISKLKKVQVKVII